MPSQGVEADGPRGSRPGAVHADGPGARLVALARRPDVILGVWIALAVLAGLRKYLRGSYNNFLVYAFSVRHAAEGQSLYASYPGQHADHFLYGPTFTLLIAPFAALPTWLGCVTWTVANAVALFLALRALPLASGARVAAWWLLANELFTALVNYQVNPMVAASLLVAFVLVREERDGWAGLVIALGTLVKLYSVAGLIFVLFSRHRARLLLACLGWGLVLAALPMAFFGPRFVARSYLEWMQVLAQKHAANARLYNYQDLSVMGVARRLLGDPTLPGLLFLVPGGLLLLAPVLRVRAWGALGFQLRLLASVLLFVVLFSSSAEGSTYVIAFTGVVVWYAAQEHRSLAVNALLGLALLVTSLSPTLLPPLAYRELVVRYALKAVPCLLVWLHLSWQLLFDRLDPPRALPVLAASRPALEGAT